MDFELRKIFYVYITASKPRGVLYVGMTSDLPSRAMEHRDRLVEGFAKKYWAGRLVYYEHHVIADSAIKRERLLKRWRRDWKIELIEKSNPAWRDLFNDVLVEFGYEPETEFRTHTRIPVCGLAALLGWSRSRSPSHS